MAVRRTSLARRRPDDATTHLLAVIVTIGFAFALPGLLGAAGGAARSLGGDGRSNQPTIADAGVASSPAGAIPRSSSAELWAALGGDPAAGTAPPLLVTGNGDPTGLGAPAPEPVLRSSAPPDTYDAVIDLETARVPDHMSADDALPPQPAPSPTPTAAAATQVRSGSVAVGPNLLDADSAGFEGSIGRWKQWFSDTLALGAGEGYTGSRSLRVRITRPHGWGVELEIWPGFAATPGRYIIGFAARAESAGVSEAKMTVHWHRGGIDIGSTELDLALSETWRQASTHSTAPSGTTHVRVDFRNRSGGPGDSLLLDDIVVAPA